MRNRILLVALASMGMTGLALVSQAQQRGGRPDACEPRFSGT